MVITNDRDSIALCMFVAGELKEHRIQDKMSDCLKGKREAERGSSQKTLNISAVKFKQN